MRKEVEQDEKTRGTTCVIALIQEAVGHTTAVCTKTLKKIGFTM